MPLTFVQGALEPPFDAILWDETKGIVIPLGDVTEVTVVIRQAHGATEITGSCDVVELVDPDSGQTVLGARYNWVEGDTDRPGDYLAEHILHWDNREQVVPNNEPFPLRIRPRL